jgi:hypothetical protein
VAGGSCRVGADADRRRAGRHDVDHRPLGAIPLAAIVTLLTTGIVTHTRDVGHVLGMDVRLDPALAAVAFEWGRSNVVRRPGFFGPELAPPAGSDELSGVRDEVERAAVGLPRLLGCTERPEQLCAVVISSARGPHPRSARFDPKAGSNHTILNGTVRPWLSCSGVRGASAL